MAAGLGVTAGAAAAAEKALAACRARGLMAVTAESCTGGLVAAALTARAGASDVVEGGFVTYSNALKMRLLGVRADMLDRHGAVSEDVARAMAAGAVARSGADLAVAVTGIAGPGGGSAEKPVGLVFFATAGTRGPIAAARHVFAGGRAEIRAAAVLTALGMLEDAAHSLEGPAFGAGTQRP